MGQQTYIRRRGAVYYVVMPVPTHLQKVLGRAQIWKSLGTKDADVMRRTAPAVIAEFQRQFAELEKSHYPTTDELRRLVQTYASDQIAEDAQYRAERGTLSPSAYEARSSMNQSGLAGMRSKLARGDTSFAEGVAEGLAEKHRLQVDPASSETQSFVHDLARALVNIAEVRVERDRGRFDAKFTDPVLTTPIPEPTPQGEQVEELFKSFKRQKTNLTEHTGDDYEVIFGYFVDFIGKGKPISAITKPVVRGWKEKLLSFPKFANNKREFKNLSFNDVFALNQKLNKPVLGPKSVNKWLSVVGSFFKWAIREGHADTNPVDGLQIQIEKGHSRDPFVISDLNKLFAGPLWTGCQGDTRGERHIPGTLLLDNHHKWLPLLGIFTGARSEELLRLRIDDVVKIDDVPCINITTIGGRSLKTRNAKRIVPIHDELIKLGFLDLVECKRRGGEIDIFGSAKENNRNKRSSEYSKDIGAYLKGVGLKTDLLTYHSTRHSFMTYLEQAGLSKSSIQLLVGHDVQDTTDAYIHRNENTVRLGVEGRKAIIDRLKYDGLDLSHLYPKAP